MQQTYNTHSKTQKQPKVLPRPVLKVSAVSKTPQQIKESKNSTLLKTVNDVP